MTNLNAKNVWEAVLGKLEIQVTRPSYETWLKDTVGMAFDNGSLFVRTPNTFVSEMLEQRMYTLISSALEQVTSNKINIRFQVQPQQLGVGESTYSSFSTTTDNYPPDEPSKDLNAKYTFDTFVVGKSNELAHAAALAVSENPGTLYNPLVIYSDVGLGKTHLLHAIGHTIIKNHGPIIHTTTEEFTNAYIKAIRDGTTEEFRNKYRNTQALLLDDVQFLIGKEQTQEGFFHTFNELHMTGRQVIITGDEPARQSLLEERIKSRLQGGLVADIQPPDFETRSAILRSKLDGMNVRIPTQVLDSLAQRSLSNVRELEGYLHRIVAYAQLTGRPITPEMANDAVRSLLAERPKRSAPTAAVVNAVAEHTGIDEDALRGQRRDQRTASARRLAMYLLREESHLPSTRIGQLLGGKDHSTVLYAQKKLEEDLERDPQLRQALVSIRQSIAAATLT